MKAHISSSVTATGGSGLISLGSAANGTVQFGIDSSIIALRSYVQTAVPANAVFTDTLYTHPTSHSISMITGLQTELNKISKLETGVSGLSLGGGTGADHRFALHEVGIGDPFYTPGSYFYGLALFVNSHVAGLAFWGGSGAAVPEQATGSGALPHMVITAAGRVGIAHQNPSEVLHVTGNILATGSITGASKSFDIKHEGRDGYRLRHWCIEGDAPGGSLVYKRQITAPKAGLADLIMPSWFAWLAKNVMVFCNGFKHHGTAWGEQDELDPCVIHLNVSKGGIYNVLVTADRADMCATTMCPQETEYIPAVESSTEDPFPNP
jgi:hypothetical protein